MPHQCVRCGKVYKEVSKELLEGCSCGSRFFFFIKEEQFEKLMKEKAVPIELKKEEKERIEKDIREILGIKEEKPVILDLESVRVLEPGKFEIDLVNLFRKDRPLIFKLEEGKYIIDLASSFEKSLEEMRDKKRRGEK